MAKDQKLATLQNWLKTVVVTPGYLPQKLGKARHLHSLDENDVVVNDGGASIYARLQVYSSGYLLRLLDCMYADYPVSREFMGNEVFDSFARAYLVYHPSSSFTLYDLGKAFPGFLANTKPPAALGDDQEIDNFMSLPIALAMLERARQEAMRAPGTEGMAKRDQEVGMQDILFNTIKVHTPECLQLLELDFPMIPFFKTGYRESDLALPSPHKTYTAISRKNFRITMVDITGVQYTLLSVCQTETNFYEAITTTASFHKIAPSALLADVFAWIPQFELNGLIYWV